MFIFVPSLCERYSYANGGGPVFVPLRVNDKPTLSKMSIDSKNLHCLPGTPCKRTQRFRPTVPNIVGCYTLRPFAHSVAFCCVLLGVIAQSSKTVKLFSRQLSPFLFLFRDRRSLAQQPAQGNERSKYVLIVLNGANLQIISFRY